MDDKVKDKKAVQGVGHRVELTINDGIREKLHTAECHQR